MSGRLGAVDPLGVSDGAIRSHWGWFVALGALMLILGFVALGDVVAVSIISVIFIGAMMLVSGVFQIIHSIATRGGWRHFLFGLLSGVIYVIGGALIMQEPIQGSVVITIFLLAAIVIGGILRITIAMRHRDVPGWWLMVLGGLISVVLGVMLYLALPWSGLWVLGTLIGVELIVQGITWLRFGFALRSARV